MTVLRQLRMRRAQTLLATGNLTLDQVAKLGRMLWLAGQGGYGIQTAPAVGWLAAALVAGDPVPSDLLACGVDVAELSPVGIGRALISLSCSCARRRFAGEGVRRTVGR
jgi:hypothetical protein